MADRRMFSKKIIDSDAFLDMPISAQLLYFHLSMRADDDGFVNNPKRIQRMIGCFDDDFKILLAKRFLIAFESGIVVIKHWRIHNYIAKDRYHSTDYADEMARLTVKENGSYTEVDGSLYTTCIQSVDNLYTEEPEPVYTEVRLGKVSIGKDSIGKNIEEPEPVPADAPPKKTKGIFQEFAGDDHELLEALKEFNDMRNRKKRPMTDKAKQRLCSKLRTMFGDDREAMIASIVDAADHSWTDVYDKRESKEEKQNIGTGRKEPVFKPGTREQSSVSRMTAYLDELKGDAC